MTGLGDARRVLVYGVTGSGKTTLARRISDIAGLPFHSVDDEVGWLPGWVERPVDDQVRIMEQITAGDAWVLDTAYGRHATIIPRAQLIVALDYARWVSLWRLVRRTVHRVRTQEVVCNGNVETLRLQLASDSIIRWHFRSFARKRDRIRAWETDPAMPPVLRFTSPRATEHWLAELATLPVPEK